MSLGDYLSIWKVLEQTSGQSMSLTRDRVVEVITRLDTIKHSSNSHRDRQTKREFARPGTKGSFLQAVFM